MDDTQPFLKSLDNPANRNVNIPLDELINVFLLLEDLNALLHQANLTPDQIKAFTMKQGDDKRLNHAYYTDVWNWLPADVQQALLNR